MLRMLSQLGAAQELRPMDRWLLYATVVLHRIRRLSAHHLFPHWGLVEKHQREIRKHPKTTRKKQNKQNRLKERPIYALSPSTAVYGKTELSVPLHAFTAGKTSQNNMKIE